LIATRSSGDEVKAEGMGGEVKKAEKREDASQPMKQGALADFQSAPKRNVVRRLIADDSAEAQTLNELYELFLLY
jgi:hypothetical protein